MDCRRPDTCTYFCTRSTESFKNQIHNTYIRCNGNPSTEAVYVLLDGGFKCFVWYRRPECGCGVRRPNVLDGILSAPWTNKQTNRLSFPNMEWTAGFFNIHTISYPHIYRRDVIHIGNYWTQYSAIGFQTTGLVG